MTFRELKQNIKALFNEFRRVIENSLEDVIIVLDQLYYLLASFLTAAWRAMWKPINDFLSDPFNSMLTIWFLVLLTYILMT